MLRQVLVLLVLASQRAEDELEPKQWHASQSPEISNPSGYTMDMCEEALCMEKGSMGRGRGNQGQTNNLARCKLLSDKGFGCTWGKWMGVDHHECRINACHSELTIWCAKMTDMKYVCNDNKSPHRSPVLMIAFAAVAAWAIWRCQR